MDDNTTYPGMSENFCSFTLVIHVMLLISFVTTIALLKTASKMISKNTDIVWSNGWNVLIKAAAEQNKKLEFLCKSDPDTGLTWLLKACLCGRAGANLVQFLLSNGANPHALSRERDNALLLASFAICHHKDADNDIIEMLTASGIDINQSNRRGYTPLSIAAANGNMSLVTTLMYYGGDPNIPNNDGTLPVQLAASFGHYDVAKLLTQ